MLTPIVISLVVHIAVFASLGESTNHPGSTSWALYWCHPHHADLLPHAIVSSSPYSHRGDICEQGLGNPVPVQEGEGYIDLTHRFNTTINQMRQLYFSSTLKIQNFGQEKTEK